MNFLSRDQRRKPRRRSRRRRAGRRRIGLIDFFNDFFVRKNGLPLYNSEGKKMILTNYRVPVALHEDYELHDRFQVVFQENQWRWWPKL